MHIAPILHAKPATYLFLLLPNVDRGHTVGHIIPTPANAGDYEFEVDGGLLSLDEARALLEADAAQV
jgi:hypothetical protein